MAEELSGRSNITILEADMASHDAIKVLENSHGMDFDEAVAADTC